MKIFDGKRQSWAANAALTQSLHQQGRHQQQRAAEQGGQVDFAVHVEAVQPMLLRPEAVNARLHDAVGQQEPCGDGHQQLSDRSWRERNDSDLAWIRCIGLLNHGWLVRRVNPGIRVRV